MPKRAVSRWKRLEPWQKPRVPVFTCPGCEGTSFIVTDSRGFVDRDGVRRCRTCRTCGHKLHTEEYAIQPSHTTESCARDR